MRLKSNSKTMKQKYDSSVIFLYATGNEALLPKEFRQQIPYTTISTWRKTDYSSYLGNEFRYFFDEAFEAADLKYKYRHLKRTMMSFAKSWIILSNVIKPVLRKTKNNKQLQKKILNAVGYMEKYLGREKALKLLGMSQTLFQQWQLEDRFSCFDSYTSLCVKRHPHHRYVRNGHRILSANGARICPQCYAFFCKNGQIIIISPPKFPT